MALPLTRRWTRVEYERLVDLRVFQPGERLELIDGLLIVSEPQGSRHAATIRRVLDALRALGDAWQIDSQLRIVPSESWTWLWSRAIPVAYRDRHPPRAVLIVEVAETSHRADREYKASLYARASVPGYWIIDLVHSTVEVHRVREPSPDTPCGSRYGSVVMLRPPATVALLVAPGRPIPVADLLP